MGLKSSERPRAAAVQIEWRTTLPAPVIAVAATPAMSRIVAACVDGHGYALDASGTPVWSFATENELWAAACAADGATIAFGSASRNPADGAVHVLDRDGGELARFELGMPVWGLAFDRSGARLAATTWGNECRLYEQDHGSWRETRRIALDGAGAYGVHWIGESILAIVCYGRGVAIYNALGEPLADYGCETAGYNVAADANGNLVVGSTDPALIVISRSGQVTTRRIAGGSRAIAAVATLDDGSLHFAGGFDGRVRALTPSGTRLWEIDLTGEIWSCATTPTGRQLVVGAGDGRVTLLASDVGVDVLRELDARAGALQRGRSNTTPVTAYQAFLDVAARHGLYRYALDFVEEEAEAGRIDEIAQAALIEHLGDACPDEHDDSPAINYQRGRHRQRAGRPWDAAVMFLQATRPPALRLQAYSAAASEFYRAGHPAAALACFRRAREPSFTAEDLRLVYTLARSFESKGELAVARDHLDTILVQDPHYRDVASRLTQMGDTVEPSVASPPDYRELNVHLLGPDGPTADIDPRLQAVVTARAREMSVSDQERAGHVAVMEQLFASGALAPRTAIADVTYDTSAYVRYDFLLPEDDVKKKLEAVNLIGLLKRVDHAVATLDVGTATGRYPGILQGLGYRAHGIDISADAIAYARSKFPPDRCPDLRVGDVRALPYSDAQFDFVSCMMGTFYHIPLEDQARALAEMARVCRPGGIVAISTWDLECPHQTFLSMYSVNEEELIVRNARRITELESLFRDTGFGEVGAIRLGLVPDTISYDLGVETLDQAGLRRLLEIDMAARAATPDKHGQMFIAHGRVV
jgi:SAM-dependent methyltransferase/outer membrane protein assembly factor BamB